MLYRGLNNYHFVPEYQGSEERASVIASLWFRAMPVIAPVALVLVVVMVIVRLCDVY